MPKVNTEISDIFFNLDHDDAVITGPRGEFIGYNRDALSSAATMLLNSLARLGVDVCPIPADLVDDFLGRV